MSVVVDSLRGVKQVIKVRLLPTEAEAAALDTTLRTCNAAATWLSQQMHAARGVDRWGEVMRPYAAPTLTASEGASTKPIGDSALADKPDALPLVTTP